MLRRTQTRIRIQAMKAKLKKERLEMLIETTELVRMKVVSVRVPVC